MDPESLRKYALETNGDAADDVFGRSGDLKLVVHGRVKEVFVEKIPYRQDHLPLAVGEVEEGKRLTDLNIESGAKSRPQRRCVGAREARVDLVNNKDPRVHTRHLALDRCREVAHLLELPADHGRHHQGDTG